MAPLPRVHVVVLTERCTRVHMCTCIQGCDADVASFLLEANQWNVEAAVNQVAVFWNAPACHVMRLINPYVTGGDAFCFPRCDSSLWFTA